MQALYKQGSFDKNKMFAVSEAAGNMGIWLTAILFTYDALEVVDPKRAQMNQAETDLSCTQELLREKVEALA